MPAPLTVDETAAVAAAEEFVDGLTPDECGREQIGDFLLMYEGFSDICWDDAQAKGKTIESLEAEIVADWNGRLLSMILVKWGWREEPEFFEDTVFWAVYRPCAQDRKAA